MTLHCLNALRVIAEFLVVSSHITCVDVNNKYPCSFGGANSMMSFFFVLSGFVAFHSQKSEGPDHQYLMRRLRKTYPLYLLMWILGLPACIVHMYVGRQGSCIVQRWIYLWLQPLCMETLLGWDIDGSNIPGWYYS